MPVRTFDIQMPKERIYIDEARIFKDVFDSNSYKVYSEDEVLSKFFWRVNYTGILMTLYVLFESKLLSKRLSKKPLGLEIRENKSKIFSKISFTFAIITIALIYLNSRLGFDTIFPNVKLPPIYFGGIVDISYQNWYWYDSD